MPPLQPLIFSQDGTVSTKRKREPEVHAYTESKNKVVISLQWWQMIFEIGGSLATEVCSDTH